MCVCVLREGEGRWVNTVCVCVCVEGEGGSGGVDTCTLIVVYVLVCERRGRDVWTHTPW